MKQLKDLYKDYTRTREQRTWFIMGIIIAFIGTAIAIFALPLFLVLLGFMAIVGAMMLLMHLINKWIEKGERY
jgi:hypothetical protein